MRKKSILTLISSTGIAALLLAVLTHATPLLAQEGRPPVSVTVKTLEAESVVLSSTLPGRVRASAEAEVRPQVNGIVVERLFTQGSKVKSGDVLYRIDRGSYEAALSQAQAGVRQAQALLKAAELEAARVTALLDRGISSEATADNVISTRDSADASLELAKAQLDAAQLELDRTDIRARLSGLIGFSQVSQGALVTASQSTPLAVIRNIDPVYVDVTQSAAELLEWRRRQIVDGEIPPSKVRLKLADGTTYEHTGELAAAEPFVNEQTGVVSLRLEFANPDTLLLPGMYVQVEMPAGSVEGVFMVPQEGVSRDRRGNPTALIVNADNKVEQRQLEILQERGSNWIVSEGIQPGDRVILAGIQKVSPGDTVNPEEVSGKED